MKKIRGIAFAAILLVLASMFASCDAVTTRAVTQGISNGIDRWKQDPNNPVYNKNK